MDEEEQESYQKTIATLTFYLEEIWKEKENAIARREIFSLLMSLVLVPILFILFLIYIIII